MKFVKHIFLFYILVLKVNSQSLLTLEDAIHIGIENNFQNKIDNNNILIVENKNTKYYNGYYPEVSLNAAEDINLTNTKQKFTTGTEVDKRNVRSDAFNAGINLNYNIFDGGYKKNTYKLTNEQAAGQRLFTQSNIANLKFEISKIYYTIVKEKILLNGLNAVEQLINERQKLMQLRFETGNANRQEFIQSTIDQNNIISQKNEQKHKIEILKIELNQWLNRDPKIEYEVIDTITFEGKKVYEDFQRKMESNNLDILNQKNKLAISQIEYSIKGSGKYPGLAFHTRYAYGNNTNSAGFSLLNRNLGIYSGLSLNWTLYNGYKTKTDLKNQNLQIENETIGLYLITMQMNNNLYKAIRMYNNYCDQIQFEKKNELLAKENINLSIERLRLGNTNILEVKDAESSYQNILNKIVEFSFGAKLEELKIMELINQ